ncbi:unknown [Clostridium sp. CAG:813]|nr:unknown [Clostridium sp. CAG:813]
MGIEATSSSSTVSSTTSSAQVSSASNSDSAKKTSTDSSFKDEMDKVSSKEDKKDSKVEETKSKDAKEDDDNLTLNGNADYSQYGSLSINDANKMLSSDIMQMMAQNGLAQVSETSEVQAASSIFSFGSDNTNQVSLTQNDAQFFINLTKSEDVSGQNIALQAQNMIANGGDFAEVAQNAKISQTLLNALSNARETNQPLRIDFDQNVSVILRIGQDGALSARFIPGDKAVEQYLRNNIESLKATFRENDLPYSDLSYSNSSKQQNERRRNKQQQGE